MYSRVSLVASVAAAAVALAVALSFRAADHVALQRESHRCLEIAAPAGTSRAPRTERTELPRFAQAEPRLAYPVPRSRTPTASIDQAF
jgi:hypothetical protein